ncbi:MAG: type II toxin-antitoxin system RelE/ParE family toxin [Bacteroidia bacterium]
MNRNIIFYESHFTDFYIKQKPKVQRKIEYVLDLIRNLDRVPTKFLTHMTGTDGLFEIRVQAGNEIFRIFSFFDEGNLVVLINGFQKKTQKTPSQELALAKKLKRKYFKEKEH